MNPEDTKPQRTASILNRSAVAKYALTISEKHRAGKFTRVGKDFFRACEASLESRIRGIVNSDSQHKDEAPELRLTTGKAAKNAAERLEQVAKAIIFGKVLRHPSVGCTLKD